MHTYILTYINITDLERMQQSVGMCYVYKHNYIIWICYLSLDCNQVMNSHHMTGNSLASTNTVQTSIVTKHLLLFSCILYVFSYMYICNHWLFHHFIVMHKLSFPYLMKEDVYTSYHATVTSQHVRLYSVLLNWLICYAYY